MSRKVQLPVIGGIRKVVKVGADSGTTIAEFGAQSITLAQLKAALGFNQDGTSTVNTGGVGATPFLQTGPGLSGGGPLIGNVRIDITQPPALILDGEDGQDGLQGLPGARGPQGLAGLPGIQGQDGEDGADGSPGSPGSPGVAGSTGPAGTPGMPGLDGMDGEDGMMGVAGAPGPTGATGSPGPTGGTGMRGMDGDDGEDGMMGLQGPRGFTGLQGLRGNDGTDGDDGLDGIIGPIGAPGPAGAAGSPGLPGAQGLYGMDGNDGDDGMQGVAGLPGVAGPIGPGGMRGMDGDDGDDGMMGLPGPRGLQGLQGLMGMPGTDGEDGDDGGLYLLPTPGSSSGAVGANPTALVGLTAVNGTALTFLRSDGSPAIDQSISPTWTGNHIMTPASGVALRINAASGQVGLVVYETAVAKISLFANAAPQERAFWSYTEATSLCRFDSDGGFEWAPNNTSKVTLNSAGQMGIAAPTSGVALTITQLSGQYALLLTGDANAQNLLQLNSTSATSGRNCIVFINSGAVTRTWAVGVDVGGTSTGDFAFRNVTAATLPLTIKASNGAVTIAAPAAAGVCLTLNGIAGSTTLNVLPADSASVGIRILDPGANATDARFNTTNSQVNIQALGTSTKLNLQAGAGVITTSPTVASSVGLDLAAGNGAATLRIAAGTTTVQPLQFTSGTNLTTATQGAIEYDGTVMYFTPAASSRAVNLVEYFEVQSATHTLTSQTAAQALLNTTANGAVTLPIGIYEFECYYELSSMSASAGQFGFALAGAATFTQTWLAEADKPAAIASASAAATTSHNTTANVAISPSTTGTVGWAYIQGIIRVTVAGTVIPQVSLGVAAAAVVAINSYFRCRPIGTANSVGNWS